MAITAFDEIHEGRSLNVGDKNVHVYRRSWRVETDDPATEQLEIRYDGRCPRRGDIYVAGASVDQGATCRTVDITQDDNRLFWTVSAEYSTARDKKEKEEQQEPNPLLRPAKIFWEMNHYQKPIEKAVDSSSTPILNAAFDPFDPTPEIDDVRLGLRIEKNLPSYDVLTAYAYTNAINSDAFLGAAVRTWKVREISNAPGEQSELIGDPPVEVIYYPVTFIFDYREETWDLKILNAGYRAIVTGAGKLSCVEGTTTQIASTDITARNALSRVNFPWPLSANGTQLASTDASQVNYLTFQVYNEKPFSALGVP